MRVYTGTSGFSYKEWVGAFYPEGTKPADMLAYYATRLRAVEINNTFYRLPRVPVLEGWAESVDPNFRFVFKASRRITHFKRLKPEALSETEYLVESTASIGDKRGVILMQLPPNFPRDVDRLREYLAAVPGGVRLAFEFRHASWFDDDVFGVLKDHGHALCIADGEGQDAGPVATADWGYLRLRRPDYTEDELDIWAETIRSKDWGDVYVFFKHEDEGAGPEMAEAFAARFTG